MFLSILPIVATSLTYYISLTHTTAYNRDKRDDRETIENMEIVIEMCERERGREREREREKERERERGGKREEKRRTEGRKGGARGREGERRR